MREAKSRKRAGAAVKDPLSPVVAATVEYIASGDERLLGALGC
jgi:hypothetical protein